jgi:RHS repeat-associated protein
VKDALNLGSGRIDVSDVPGRPGPSGGYTSYLRDPSGRLLARTDTSGTGYYVFDALGSTRAVVDDTGVTVATYRFGPYGTVESQTGALQQPFGFVGQLGYHADPSGVVQVGIRSYLPEVGRWTQPDPTRQDANLYLYAAGDPINLVDPTGAVSANDVLVGLRVVSFVAATVVLVAATGGTVALAYGAVGHSTGAELPQGPSGATSRHRSTVQGTWPMMLVLVGLVTFNLVPVYLGTSKGFKSPGLVVAQVVVTVSGIALAVALLLR